MDRGTWGLEEKQIDMGFLSLSTTLNVYYKKKKKKKNKLEELDEKNIKLHYKIFCCNTIAYILLW